MTYFYKLLWMAVFLLPETRAFAFKAWLLRRLGFAVHSSARLVSSFQIIGKPALFIGEDSYIGHNFRIYGDAAVTLGARIDIGPEVSLITGTHAIDANGPRVAGEGRCDPIVIGDGCWIGARSMVLGGSVIGAHCLIAAGSIVRGHFEPHSLIGGNPAKRVRDLRDRPA